MLLPKVAVATVSISVPWCAFRLGGRISATHGFLAGLAAATWFELIQFAAHPLTETASVAAFAAGTTALMAGRQDWRRLSAAGFLFAVAAILRFQYLPAIALLMLWDLRLDWRRWKPVMAGGLLALGHERSG